MQLLAVVPSVCGISPGQRYRIEQWEPTLNQLGVEITYAPFDSAELNQTLHKAGNKFRKVGLLGESFLRRFQLMNSLSDYDLIYVFREAALFGPAIFERLIYRSGVPFVFDFDDAIFESYKSPSNGYLSYLKFAGKTKNVCRMAAHVIVGNTYLAQYAGRFNKQVTIVPSTIDTDYYTPPNKNAEPEVPVVGWTGSFSTIQHLDTLKPALQKLAARRPFRLRVVAPAGFSLEGVDLEVVEWRAETEVEDLRPIDVGIMPLPDTKWTRGKCGMKALQFMALGIPTVCSPVGANKEIVRDGENGFLAQSEEEWIEKLDRLLSSASLRKQLGAAARATVENNYSARVHAPRVFEVFSSVARDAQKKPHPVANRKLQERRLG